METQWFFGTDSSPTQVNVPSSSVDQIRMGADSQETTVMPEGLFRGKLVITWTAAPAHEPGRHGFESRLGHVLRVRL